MAHSIKIELNNGLLTKDAAARLYKWGEVNREDSNYQRIYNLQYSANDNVDVALLGKFVSQRMSRLCDIVSEYLKGAVEGNGAVTYNFLLPYGWNPATQGSLKRLMEDYVADGAAADWFSTAGIKQAEVFERASLEDALGIQRNIYNKNVTI